MIVLVLSLMTADTLTLEQALETAAKVQPTLIQQKALTGAAWAQAGQVGSALLPQINFNASYARRTANYVSQPGVTPTVATATTTTGQTATVNVGATRAPNWDTTDYWSGGLTASLLLFDGLATPHSWLAARANARAQEQTWQEQRVIVANTVRTAFYNAIANKALVQVAKDSLDNYNLHLKQTEGFVKAGTHPEIELATARTNVANAKVALITAQNNYDTSKVTLNNAMGVERSIDYEVADPQVAPLPQETENVPTLVEQALDARPDLRAFKEQLRAQEYAVRAAWGGISPTLSASTGFSDAGYSLNGLTWNWSAGVTLNWNLFGGLYTYASINLQHEKRAAIQAQLEGARQQVLLDVENARLGLNAAQASLDASGDALFNAQEQLRLAEGRYQAGAGSIIELGDAQVARTQSAAQKVQAQFQLDAARANLQKALGIL